MKKIFVYLLSFVLLQNIFAQKNFSPGYIVLNSGDTLKGDIDYGNKATNPESLLFRSSADPQKYTVKEVSSFGVDNNLVFVRFKVSYQQTAAELADATETFEGPVTSGDFWLRLLLKGKYSLYELNTVKRKYFFIENDKGELQELVYRVRLSNAGVMEKNEQYKNLLGTYSESLSNYPIIQKKIDKSSYKDDDLKEIMSLINGSSNSFKETNQTKALLDLSAGVNIYSFSPSGGIYNDGSGGYAIHNATFKTSFGFAIGFGVTTVSKRNRGKIQPRFGVTVASMKIDGENTTGTGSFQREKYDGNFILVEPNASINLLLSKSMKTNFLLGLIVGYNLVVSNSLTSIFENPGVVIKRDNFPDAGGGFLSTGANATVSGDWGRLNLRASKISNIFNSPQTTLSGIQFSFTYGYYIKK